MSQTPASTEYQIIAYFPGWEAARPYYVKDIEASGAAGKLTIINYAFGAPGPDPRTGEVVCALRDAVPAYQQPYTAEMSIDGQADEPEQPLRGHFNQLKKLKAKYPNIKVVISLGGWTDSGWFSDAAATQEAREKFVSACIDLYIRGDLPKEGGAGGKGAGAGVFDGIDIDWEYPVGGGLATNHARPEDAENFGLLLQEFRKQYQAIGRPELLLTAAVPGPGQAAQYKLNEAHQYLDFVNIMAYDFRGAWSTLAGHHTNLCNSALDPAPENERISADATVRLYRDTFGVPGRKLVLGSAFYGKSWKEVGAENHGLYQPGVGVEGGGGNYNELVKRLDLGYVRYWDEKANAPFLYNAAEKVFWTYDDPQSMALKAQYIQHHGLGGVMFWEITGDDAQGTLVDTLYRGLQPGAPDENPCE